MSIYDVVTTALVLILVVWVSVLTSRYQELQQQINKIRSDIAARQAQIAHARSTRQVPHVDAKARTVQRDTDDLPVTGRMSQGVKRVKVYGSERVDGRFPDRPGYSSAQVGESEGSVSSGESSEDS